MAVGILLPVIMITGTLVLSYDYASATTETANSTTITTVEEDNGVTNAATLFQSGELVLGNNVPYLVILLPNEAHESPELDEEQRLIPQPYVPQSAVITPETSVLWFNGDVGHDRKITLVKGEETVLEGDEFEFNDIYGPINFNETGLYHYYEAGVVEDDPDFVMEGTIMVNEDNDNATTLALGNDTQILGVILVPAEDLEEHVAALQAGGLDIDSSHTFEDLKGGDEQTLIVWTGDPNQEALDQAIQTLQGITETLPYS